jgi:hypothetical protein
MRAAKSAGGRQYFAFQRGRLNLNARVTAMSMPSQFPAPRLLLAAALLAAAAALGGCETTGVGVAQAKAQPAPEPLTRTQAAEICWMSTEHGHADLPLAKRADLVDECIKEKLAGAPETKDVKAAQQANAKKR